MEVIKVRQLDPRTAVVRDLALATFQASTRGNTRLTSFLKKYRSAKILKKTAVAWTVQIVDTPEAIESFLKGAAKHKLLHISRTGATATDAHLRHS